LADASNVRLLNIPKRHHWSLCSQVTIHGSGTCAGAILLGMLRTAFTELVGCQVPIQLAPMGGGVVTPELAIAVSGAGGLGMLQRADPTPLADRITQLEQAHTAQPSGDRRRRGHGPVCRPGHRRHPGGASRR
jgi:Nitronate monooxygenase